MVEKAKIEIYAVDRCGYYERGNDDPEFGSLDEVLIDLRNWATALEIGDTATFEADEERNVLPVYCFDIRRDTASQAHLLITWNRTETLDGEFGSVDAASYVGEGEVSTSPVPAGGIPGYPTYFWLMPSVNRFATIRFGTRLNGHPGLQRYVQGFLSFYSRFVSTHKTEDEIIVDGYVNNGHVTHAVRPRFGSSRLRSGGQIAMLRTRCNQICKMVHKEELAPTDQQDNRFWTRLLERVGLAEPADLSDQIRFRYEVDYTPTEDEFDEIFNAFERVDGHSTWTDVGFALEGDTQKIHWLSHSRKVIEVELDVQRADGIVSAESLIEGLRPLRLEEVGDNEAARQPG